jgi:hypothetical protein
VCVLLLAASCQQPVQQTGASAPRHNPAQLGFATLASAEQLGATWQEANHGQPRIRAVELAPDGSFALVTLARRQPWIVKTGNAPADANVLWVQRRPLLPCLDK